MIKTEVDEHDFSLGKVYESVYSEPDTDINLFTTTIEDL